MVKGGDIRNGAKKISLPLRLGDLIRNGIKNNKSPHFVWET